MATRFIHKGPEIPEAVSLACGFGVDTSDQLVLHRGTTYGNEHIAVQRVINATTSFTLTAADSGALILANSTTSIVATLPATSKGLRYTMAVVQLTTTGSGHGFSPNSADKIMGNGLTAADDKDVTCTAATDRDGDTLTIVGDGSNGWYIAGVTGTWARET